MADTEMSKDEIDGRLIALRQMVAQLLAAHVLGPDARAALAEELLHEGFMPTDQQGGPDTVPQSASDRDRAALEEKRLTVEEAARLVKERRGAPDAARGPSRVAPPDTEDPAVAGN